MNNQIRELAKQALQKCMDENGFLNNTNWRINADHYAESEVFEKFAELIVRECAKHAEHAKGIDVEFEAYFKAMINGVEE